MFNCYESGWLQIEVTGGVRNGSQVIFRKSPNVPITITLSSPSNT